MGNAFLNASYFVVKVIFDLYIYVVLLRLLLQYVSAPYHNPLCQFVIKLTQPIYWPVRRVIPTAMGIDFALLFIVFLLSIIKIMLLVIIKAQIFPFGAGVLVWSFGDLLNQIFNLYFYIILLVVILSWVAPGQHNPIVGALTLLTEPLLRPARNAIPPISGFDLSPIVVLLVLKVLDILFVDPIVRLGISMM